MCTRVVINKSIQYKINEFAICNVSRKQHRIHKMVSRYFQNSNGTGSLVDERTLQLASSPYHSVIVQEKNKYIRLSLFKIYFDQ